MEDADGADGGRTGKLRRAGGRRTGGLRAKERQTGGQGADEQTGGQHGEWRQTSGRADGRMRADGARTGGTSGRAGGLKGPAPRSPLHSRAPRLLASLQSEFARRLGVHWGPNWGYVILFFALNSIIAIQAQHYCEVCAKIVLALSRIVTRNLWRERTILWFRRY